MSCQNSALSRSAASPVLVWRQARERHELLPVGVKRELAGIIADTPSDPNVVSLTRSAAGHRQTARRSAPSPVPPPPRMTFEFSGPAEPEPWPCARVFRPGMQLGTSAATSCRLFTMLALGMSTRCLRNEKVRGSSPLGSDAAEYKAAQARHHGCNAP